MEWYVRAALCCKTSVNKKLVYHFRKLAWPIHPAPSATAPPTCATSLQIQHLVWGSPWSWWSAFLHCSPLVSSGHCCRPLFFAVYTVHYSCWRSESTKDIHLCTCNLMILDCWNFAKTLLSYRILSDSFRAAFTDLEPVLNYGHWRLCVCFNFFFFIYFFWLLVLD